MSHVPAIELRALTCGYKDRTILDSIDITVERGDFYAIMGANGCGKTTLLRCIAGLLPPRKGEVMIGGKRLSDYSPRHLAQQLSLVRQHQQTDLDFTTEEIVMMGRNPYQSRLANESEEDRSIVEDSMRLTNTLHLRKEHPWSISGGELQRVMIARSLAQQTPIMLLDEPISNLDISHQFEIMDMLVDFNSSQGKTILIVVHDINLAYRYCPQLILLHNKQVLYQGPTAEGFTEERIEEVFGVKAHKGEEGITLRRR